MLLPLAVKRDADVFTNHDIHSMTFIFVAIIASDENDDDDDDDDVIDAFFENDDSIQIRCGLCGTLRLCCLCSSSSCPPPQLHLQHKPRHTTSLVKRIIHHWKNMLAQISIRSMAHSMAAFPCVLHNMVCCFRGGNGMNIIVVFANEVVATTAATSDNDDDT